MRAAISGLQEAQKANLKHVRDLRAGTSLNRAIKWGGAAAHRAAITATPWDTSALRNSHRIKFDGGQHRATIHIDPGAVNPRGQRPSRYGPHLHAQGKRSGLKGGVRAFYEYTVEQYGAKIGQGMAKMFISRFKK